MAATLTSRLATNSPLSLRQKASLAAEIFTTYMHARRLLRRHSLPQALQTLRGRPGEASAAQGNAAEPAPGQIVTAVKLGRAVTRTLRALPTDDRCLIRSVTLAALLADREIDCRVVIGARAGSDFSAHAWVEVAHLSVLETDPAVFQPMWRG
jgi:hypothetical protein